MKIIKQKKSLAFFLALHLCYLISDHNSSHLRNKLTFTSKMKSKAKAKSHLFPSTTENCGPLCLECSQNDLQSCITCRPGIFEFKNKCFTACPENTFADEEWQICSLCDASCPVCWGPTSEMCGTRKGSKTSAVLLENEIKQFLLQKKFKNYDRIGEQRKQEEKEKDELLESDSNINRDFNNVNNYVSKAIGNYQEGNSLSNNEERDSSNKYNNNSDNKNLNNAQLNKLNVILKDVPRENLFPQSHKNKVEFNSVRKEIDTATISMEDVYGSNKVLEDLPIGSFSRKDGVFIPIPSYLDENMEIVESHWVYVRGAWLGNKWMQEWVPVLPSFIKHYGQKNKMYFENGGYWVFDNRKGLFFVFYDFL